MNRSRGSQSVSIVCADGTTLAAMLFEPEGEPRLAVVIHGAAAMLFEPEGEPRLAVVIHGAAAVPRDYYARFAAWLSAEREAAVLIYDYRDFGASATVPVSRANATMAAWGTLDQSAALDYLCGRFPGLPVEGIGHSMGGMFLAFHKNARHLRRFTAVACGPAHWTRHPLGFAPVAIAFWFAVGPLLARAFGYMPGRLIGLGADVPAGVYWQWRRWCVSPQRQFHRPDWGQDLPMPDPESITCPLTTVAIADDPMIPPDVVRDLAQFYPRAQIENRIITPADAGTPAIGHLRVFSERCRSVWPLLAG